jgi:hypothetical protein
VEYGDGSVTAQKIQNAQSTQTPAPPQISFTIILHDWINLTQFKAIQQVIFEGLERYGHFVASYTNGDIPPSTVDFPAHIMFQGIDPNDAAVQAQIMDAINNALASIPGFVQLQMEPPQ